MVTGGTGTCLVALRSLGSRDGLGGGEGIGDSSTGVGELGVEGGGVVGGVSGRVSLGVS